MGYNIMKEVRDLKDEQYNLGQKIRDCRKIVGMTMKELGIKLGLSEQAISQYERGKRIPSVDIIKSIAVVLDVSINELLGARDLTDEDSEILDFLYGEGLVGLRDVFKEFNFRLSDDKKGNIIISKGKDTIAIPEKDFIELGNEMLKHFKEFKEFEIHKLLTKVNNREGK